MNPRENPREQHYIRMLPMLAELSAVERALFAEGIRQLESEGIQQSRLELTIGVVAIEEGELAAHYFTKTECVRRALTYGGVSARTILAILEPPRPGTVDMLVLCGHQIVFGMPVRSVDVPMPGSENN